MGLDIGLGVITGQVPVGSERTVADEYRDILALARFAEDAGFDSLWVSEHHAAPDSYLPSLAVFLGALAAVTQRVSLGMAVALAPFHHPIRFAEDCAVVDQLSGGRLIVGIGAGWRQEEFDAFKIPLAERVGRTVELLKICRAAWDQETFSFHGRHFDFENVALSPRPTGYLRLMVGGSAHQAIGRAARLADGFIATPMNSLDVFRQHVGIFDESARAVGRDPDRLDIGFHTNVWISEDGAIDPALRMPLSWACQEKYEPITASMKPLDEASIRRLAQVGNAEQLVSQLGPWIQGFRDRNLHAILRLHYPGINLETATHAIRVFSTDVMPRLRKLAAEG